MRDVTAIGGAAHIHEDGDVVGAQVRQKVLSGDVAVADGIQTQRFFIHTSFMGQSIPLSVNSVQLLAASSKGSSVLNGETQQNGCIGRKDAILGVRRNR